MTIWMKKLHGDPLQVEDDPAVISQHLLKGFRQCQPPAMRAAETAWTPPERSVDEDEE